MQTCYLKILVTTVLLVAGVAGKCQLGPGSAGKKLNSPVRGIPASDSLKKLKVKDTIPYVKIGNQVWSSVNLNVAKYRNGDIIPQVTDYNQWKNLTTGAWCWYQNDSAKYSKVYGRLYNWYAVKDPRGLAPEGWHIPTVSEWCSLIKFVDKGADTARSNVVSSQHAGGLRQSGTALWLYSNNEANNATGFNAVPSGARKQTVGGFGYAGYHAFWWTADPYKVNGANASIPWASHIILSYDNWFSKADYLYTTGYAVRIVKD